MMMFAGHQLYLTAMKNRFIFGPIKRVCRFNGPASERVYKNKTSDKTSLSLFLILDWLQSQPLDLT